MTKILAVDDDPIIVELLTKLIPHFGDHTLLTAHSAHEALALARSRAEERAAQVEQQLDQFRYRGQAA